MKARALPLTASAAVLMFFVAVQSVGLFRGGSPTIIAPAPIPLVVLVLLLGIPAGLAVTFPPTLFCLWCWRLFRHQSKIPLRTYILYAVVFALSLPYYTVSWRYGLKYQGYLYTVSCAGLSAFLASICAVALWRGRTNPAWSISLFSHVILFLWIFSFAFPYLGEVP